MAFQKTTIPFVRGADQSVDDRVRSPDAITITNGYYERTGAVVKRHGYEQIGVNGEFGDGEVINGILSTGTELIVHTSRSLYAHNPDKDLFVYRGHVGPCIGSVKPILAGQHHYAMGDSAELDGYALHVAQRFWKNDAVSTETLTREIIVSVVSVDDETMAAPAHFAPLQATADAALVPHSPKAVWCKEESGGVLRKLKALWLKLNGAGVNTLRVTTYDATALVTEAPFAITTLFSDVHHGGENVRTFDAIGLKNGNWVLAYIQATTQNIILKLLDGANTVLQSSSITALAPYHRVALSQDPIADATGGHHGVFVLTFVLGPTVETDTGSVLIYSRALTTLAALWGPTVLEAFPGRQTADNLGCEAGLDHDGVVQIASVWTYEQDGTSVALHARQVKFDGGGLFPGSAVVERWNLVPRTRPCWRRGVPYVHADTVLAAEIYDGTVAPVHDVISPFFEVSGLYELFDTDEDETMPTMVGLWDIGTAPFGTLFTTPHRMGCVNNGWTPDAEDTYRFDTLSLDYVLIQSATGNIHFSLNHAILDFVSPPLGCVVARGSACIGGSYVCWYDGDKTQELGWAAPPILSDIALADVSGGLVIDTDYDWQAVWVSFDALGVQHRSPPSFLISKRLEGAGKDAMTMQVRTMPATQRMARVPSSVWWYRDENTIRQRISEASRLTENLESTYQTNNFTDRGQDAGPFLYTTGGDLDEISPEGARIPTVVGGRLFLGDPFRRERVQYSKPYSPGGPDDEAHAPGFNPDFGFVLPDGEAVTLQAPLDDKLIIGTRTRIYALAGRGPFNDGSQNDYSGLEVISSDIGCSEPRSSCVTPDGLVFLSAAGVIYLLDRKLGLSPIGEALRDEFEARPVVSSAVLVPEHGQVRFTVDIEAGGSGRILVYDYLIRQWVIWIPLVDDEFVELAGGCLHDGRYHYATRDGRVFRETDGWFDPVGPGDPPAQYIRLTIETGWVNGAGAGGWNRIRRVTLLGWREANCDMTIATYHDEESEIRTDALGNVTAARTWIDTQLDAINPVKAAAVTFQRYRMQLEREVKHQRCEKIRVRIFDDVGSTSLVAGTGAGFSATGIALEWMPKRGLPKSMPKAARG